MHRFVAGRMDEQVLVFGKKTGLAFVRRYIKSQDYADLLPR